jgi:hypothetical protein
MQSTLADGRWVASAKIPLFQCPSDVRDGPLDGNPLYHNAAVSMRGRDPGPCNYAVRMGSQAFGGPYPGNAFGNGPQTHGDTPDGKRISGIFGHANFGAAFADVRDGLSNTFALGEMRPKCSWHAADGTLAGTHVVCVTKTVPTSAESDNPYPETKNILPARYSSPVTSPLRADVSPAGKNFSLRARARAEPVEPAAERLGRPARVG